MSLKIERDGTSVEIDDETLDTIENLADVGLTLGKRFGLLPDQDYVKYGECKNCGTKGQLHALRSEDADTGEPTATWWCGECTSKNTEQEIQQARQQMAQGDVDG